MSSRKTPTRLRHRCSSRFQSNHQRGYLLRNSIISVGPRTSNPPPPTANAPAWPPAAAREATPPFTVKATIRMGMATKMRKNVVPRSSLRSG